MASSAGFEAPARIPAPRRPFCSTSAPARLPVTLHLPLNAYTAAEICVALQALSHGHTGRSIATVQVAYSDGVHRRCALPVLPVALTSGLVTSVMLRWIYYDGSRVMGQVIGPAGTGWLVVEGDGRALVAAHSALAVLRAVRPLRRRWLSFIGYWLLPLTCAVYVVCFAALALQAVLALRDPIPAASVLPAVSPLVPSVAPSVLALGTIGAGLHAVLLAGAVIFFVFSVLLGVIGPADRYGRTRLVSAAAVPRPGWAALRAPEVRVLAWALMASVVMAAAAMLLSAIE